MKKTRKIIHSTIAFSILAATFHTSTSSAGGGLSGFWPSHPVDSGLYLGLSAGQSKLEPHVTVPGGVVDSNSDTAYKVTAGYDFNSTLAIEAFYADMGAAHIKTNTQSSDVDYKLYGAAGVYTQPFTEKLSGLAKVGYAKVDNAVEPGVTYEQIEEGVIYGGLGLEYDLTDSLSLKAEYEYFDEDMQFLSAGINWKF